MSRLIFYEKKQKKKKKKKKTKQKEECRLLQMLLGPLKIQNNAADDSLNIIFFPTVEHFNLVKCIEAKSLCNLYPYPVFLRHNLVETGECRGLQYLTFFFISEVCTF